MARPANPQRETCLAWMRGRADSTAAEAALHFSVSRKTVEGWVKWSRTRPDMGAIPVPLRRKPPAKKQATSNLTLLPPPPKQLPDDLAELARTAVRLRLQRLADPTVVNAENSKDLRDGLSMLTSTYEFLAPMAAGTGQARTSLTSRLLGSAPPDDEDDDEELVALAAG